jgi:hypothetical protein
MEYQLEIYRPGACSGDSCIKSLTAPVLFSSIQVGDLLNTKAWGKPVERPLPRVVNVEHLISEASHGIDPAGRNHAPDFALHLKCSGYRQDKM